MLQSDEKKQFFSQSLEECASGLFQLALNLTKSPADAEDLVAETAIKAWTALESLQDQSRFRPWIFRILHNCFVSAFRKKSIRPKETSFDEVTTDSDENQELIGLLLDQSDEFLMWWANPEREFANVLLNEDIFNAIDELPEPYRVVIQLVNVEGLSYDEAAEVLAVPSGTIRSRMKRGRTMLQKRLWEHAQDAGLLGSNVLEESPA